ncbi:CaiB/BaiF CoA transferase family protein [Subtercola sp. YIM 133946]|uniref:CaiB/BaiF CoA transferase family protein n=1 Tax=Subtercola sp. YIM 133946 TaxID=3118909 RepID=UPI002F929E9C
MPVESPQDGDESIQSGVRASLLTGVKVVDLTHFLAGPFASMVLGDLGADVLKVERLTGDTTRATPPYFLGEDSAYFLSINRNKRSIALDIRSVEGKQILNRIIAEADVVLDNLRAPQRASLGLAYADLEKINPRIVSCSVSGFGSDGPYSERPAYDIVVEALAGVMSVTGPEGGPSVRAGVPIGDITAGLYAAIGTLAGLEYRRRTGRGQHIDVSMLDSQVSLLSYLAQYYFTGDLVASHQGRAHVSIPTYNTFATKDSREIVIAANTDPMWRSLCRVLGREDLADSEHFTTNPERLIHRDELIPVLQEEFAKWRLEDIYDALVKANVPVAPINTIDTALNDPQVRHRGMVVRAPHRNGGEYVTLGSPVKADEGPSGGPYLTPPGLGGDSETVLRELGYSDDEITSFRASGVVKFMESASLS